MKCKLCNMDKNKIENTILYENKYFKVVPTLGSLVDGYVMIVSKIHINSMSELNAEEKIEYENLLNKYRNIFKKIYNKYPIIFEHGSPILDSFMKANSITHAHTHIINHHYKNENKILEDLNFNKIDNLNNISNDKNYIMYINQNNVCYITNNFKPISQIMRKLIAKDLGYEEKYDWNNNVFIENIKSTINNLKNGDN